MKLVEADGKQLLRDAGITTPPGVFLSMDVTSWPSSIPWTGAVFIKSQVLQGRRGSRGLVTRCETPESIPDALQGLRERLGDMPCAGFLCEPEIKIAHEYFVSVDVDRASGEIRVSVSSAGGVDVSSAVSFLFRDLSSQTLPAPLAAIIHLAAAAMTKWDATQIEINPLVETKHGDWVALDAKIELDDAASFRHPEWSEFRILSPLGRALTEREQMYDAFLKRAGHRGTFGRYLELDGDIALILSGGGASLLALDAIQNAGGRAANYLEVSGNPEPETLREAARIALSKPGIRGLWVAGSFANFTDIQATSEAIRLAIQDLRLSIPVVIRRDGPNAAGAQEEGKNWADGYKIPFAFHRGDVSLETSARHLLSLV